MRQLRRIVVGYTPTPDGERALHTALMFAAHAHATLYLLHVVERHKWHLLVFEQE